MFRRVTRNALNRIVETAEQLGADFQITAEEAARVLENIPVPEAKKRRRRRKGEPKPEKPPKSDHGVIKNYGKITNQIRNQFIHLVETKQWNMRQAALSLEINYSTAKSIMNVYKNDGRARRKNKCRKNRKKGVDEAISPQPIEYNANTSSYSSLASEYATPEHHTPPSSQDDYKEEREPLKNYIDYDLSSLGCEYYAPLSPDLRLGFTDEEIEKILTADPFDQIHQIYTNLVNFFFHFSSYRSLFVPNCYRYFLLNPLQTIQISQCINCSFCFVYFIKMHREYLSLIHI
eukprot:TRINITY_DN5703_c0_g1_i25.p1 TRINITY_DN5703_c0_g1~~TRINITY_DN5703_c0_g1_i25.p1  ORF type:complete len:290 (-),score=9.32 TRINITY_DN5703_c0_g1_i25:62-931(-)